MKTPTPTVYLRDVRYKSVSAPDAHHGNAPLGLLDGHVREPLRAICEKDRQSVCSVFGRRLGHPAHQAVH
jgi:hypothetical protein